jgi:hypothetical protein
MKSRSSTRQRLRRGAVAHLDAVLLQRVAGEVQRRPRHAERARRHDGAGGVERLSTQCSPSRRAVAWMAAKLCSLP